MEYQPSYSFSSFSSSSSSSYRYNHNQASETGSGSSTTSHQCLTTLKGHTSYISSLTLAGEFLYSGSSDSEIRSWNCTSSEYATSNNIVHAGKGAVKSLLVQSNKLFSAHQDHKIRVWKITTNNDNKHTHVATLPTLGDRASKVLIPKNHVQIRRHKKCTWVHHVDAVSALALSKDGTLLYSVSWDRTIKVWRTKDFACLESVADAHHDAINALAVSYDGHVYTGSSDTKIKVWKKGEGQKNHSLVATLEQHKSGVNALALSTHHNLLFSAACDTSVLVWDAEGKMGVVGALRGHTKSILCLAVVADLVCSGSADKTIRIWRGINRDYCCLAVLEGHTGSIKCITAVVDHSTNPSSFLLYSGSLDCDIKVWQILVPATAT